MSETGNKTNLKEWRALLNSGNEDVLLDTLKRLRQEGSKELIRDIAEVIDKRPGRLVEESVFSFFNDLKQQDCVEPFMEFLANKKDKYAMPELVSACWQNGLDYSHYIRYFTDLVLTQSYEISIEAFTVVEQNIDHVSVTDRNQLCFHIESEMDNLSDDKLALVNELLSVVRTVSGPFSLDLSPDEY